jgi:hypothetical protein
MEPKSLYVGHIIEGESNAVSLQVHAREFGDGVAQGGVGALSQNQAADILVALDQVAADPPDVAHDLADRRIARGPPLQFDDEPVGQLLTFPPPREQVNRAHLPRDILLPNDLPLIFVQLPFGIQPAVLPVINQKLLEVLLQPELRLGQRDRLLRFFGVGL